MDMHSSSFAQLTELGQAARLPRLDASTVRACNRLYGSRNPISLQLAGQTCKLHWQVRDRLPPTGSNGGFETYGFKLGTHQGHLALDPLAHSAVLGERRAMLIPVELRYLLLADALNPLILALESATRQRFEWTLTSAGATLDANDALLAPCFELELPNASGQWCGGCVRFDDAKVLDDLSATLCGPACPGLPMQRFEVPLAFELGRTSIRLQEISGIRRGDIVSIEEWTSVGSAIGARLVLGGCHRTELTVLIDDSLVTLQPFKDLPMDTFDPSLSAASDSSNTLSTALARLDSLEVELRFEVGGQTISLRELRNVRAGHVFELDQPLNSSTVRIYAHGNMLGTGHLVAVGDRLAVRVLEFAPDGHE